MNYKLHTDGATGEDTVISTDGCARVTGTVGGLVYSFLYGHDKKANKLWYEFPVSIGEAVMLLKLRAAIAANDAVAYSGVQEEFGLGVKQ